MKGIPVIQRQDVTVVKSVIWGPYVGFVCEAQWTKPDGIKVCYNYLGREVLHFVEVITISKEL